MNIQGYSPGSPNHSFYVQNSHSHNMSKVFSCECKIAWLKYFSNKKIINIHNPADADRPPPRVAVRTTDTSFEWQKRSSFSLHYELIVNPQPAEIIR